jgi:hypothetical protein
MERTELQSTIEAAFEDRDRLKEPGVREAVEETIACSTAARCGWRRRGMASGV